MTYTHAGRTISTMYFVLSDLFRRENITFGRLRNATLFVGHVCRAACVDVTEE